jgi:hypothetical protein
VYNGSSCTLLHGPLQRHLRTALAIPIKETSCAAAVMERGDAVMVRESDALFADGGHQGPVHELLGAAGPTQRAEAAMRGGKGA